MAKSPKWFTKPVNTIFDLAIVKNKSKLTSDTFVCGRRFVYFEMIRNQINKIQFEMVTHQHNALTQVNLLFTISHPFIFHITFYVIELLLLLNDKYFIIGKIQCLNVKFGFIFFMQTVSNICIIFKIIITWV